MRHPEIGAQPGRDNRTMISSWSISKSRARRATSKRGGSTSCRPCDHRSGELRARLALVGARRADRRNRLVPDDGTERVMKAGDFFCRNCGCVIVWARSTSLTIAPARKAPRIASRPSRSASTTKRVSKRNDPRMRISAVVSCRRRSVAEERCASSARRRERRRRPRSRTARTGRAAGGGRSARNRRRTRRR
jgi:hypothetical protein